MDVQLFVYGVPNGDSFWGKEEDRNYFGSFYDNSSDEVKFLIQARTLNGKAFCYYNYLMYKNVVGNDGRNGSYFGISIRFDAYCKDVFNMYRILDSLVNVYVIGTILKKDGGKLKYTVPNFQNAANVLKGIEEQMVQMIRNAFSGESFTALNGFNLAGSSCPTANLYDCTEDIVYATVRQNGKVAISPFYPNTRESALHQQYKTQLQTMQNQCEARLKADSDAHMKEKTNYANSLSSVKKEKEQLQETIAGLKKENSRLSQELQSIGQSKRIAQIVEPIKKPIEELSTALQSIAPRSHSHGREKSLLDSLLTMENIKLFLSLFSFILLLLIAGLVFSDKINEVNDTQPAQTESTNENYAECENEDNDEFQDFNFNDVQIDIKEYDGKGPLKMDSEYVVEAVGGEVRGEWIIEGADMNETDNPDIIKITPKSENVIITYKVEEKEKSRELKAI